ncbi:YfiR family protein [Photobacterium atrarenae]|uniref:YfiR family protein n=1 Tax=Photobacterium atrarenae TaxID=865757 RepID=A0ABY5GD08_9GAMM|nr:YfiR family protein [Photobacterium atrarenae]UTV26680.1 YfiR family protein [Photobacterium atrarenae]
MVRPDRPLRRNPGRGGILSTLLLLIGLSPPVLHAQSAGHVPPPTVASEARIKALYIYYFTNFVRWPNQQHPSRFCTLGNDKVTVTLHLLIERKNQPNKQYDIQALNNLETLSAQCDIVYITADRLTYLSSVPRIKGILTVSDSDVFLHKGGMIELRAFQHRIKPAIALDHVNHSGLTISAHLLRIALLPADVESGGAGE